MRTRSPSRLLPLHALRLAVRGLSRTPGVALTAALTLGLGLSAAVALLGVWLGATRPLPVPEGEEVVQVRVLDARAEGVAPPAGVFAAWEDASGLDAVAGLVEHGGTLVTEAGPALNVAAAAMSPAVFRLLGVPAARGRVPTNAPEDRDAVVLGWELWQSGLGGDPAVLGSTVRLDDRPLTVVGVMPAGFGFPENEQLWTVLDDRGDSLPAGASLVARLADGARAERVAPALETALASLPVADGVTGPYRVRVEPWTVGRGEGDEALIFAGLGVLVALLLVVCAANVSTMLLVRATERVGTLAIHSALGAARGQVVLQLLLESLLVALAGGAVGLLAGHGLLTWMESALSDHWGYYWMHMGVRPGVLVGLLAAVAATAALAGTAPAVMALRTDLRGVLGRGATPGGTRRTVARGFVAAQVGLSTAALVAAVIMGRGLLASRSMTGDLPVGQLAVASVSPPEDRYPDSGSRTALARELRLALSALPGVRSASVSGGLPVQGGRAAALTLEGAHGPADEAAPSENAYWLAVDGHVGATYDLEVLAGRALSDEDGAPGAPPVVVVNRAFVERWLPGGQGVGARLRLDGVHADGEWATVVGIVENVAESRPSGRADQVLVPLGRAEVGSLFLSARTSGDAAEVAAALRGAVASVDPRLPVDRPGTLAGLMAWLLRIPRVIAGFGALGGLIGVLVTAIGLYGVVAFRVRSGLREVGVRMALGAPAGNVFRRVVLGALEGMLIPMALGLAAAVGVAPRLAMSSFGQAPRSVVPFLAAAGLMVAVAVLAALPSALAASRLDPNEVLRSE